MILYSLVCDQKHTFESWFRNSTAYDRMAEAGALSCPLCSSSRISKALTAPYVSTRGRLREREESPDTEKTGKAESGCKPGGRSAQGPGSVSDESGVSLSEVKDQNKGHILTDEDRIRRQAIHCVRHLVQKHCDYVGDKFPEEARKMHYGETESRPIYGEASVQESQKLQEEGVSFVCLPLSKEDA